MEQLKMAKVNLREKDINC